MKRGPHWLLSDADAKDYGAKLANAMRHLPVTMGQKYIDWSAFAVAVFSYEGPRIGMDMQMQAQKANPRPQNGPAQVFQFAPRAAPEATGPAASATQAPSPDMTYEPEADQS
jgi:hypothetical protein